MEWMLPPDGIAMCQSDDVSHPKTERASMEKVSIIGLDLAMRSFQAHGALAEGGVTLRKILTREKVLGSFAVQIAAWSAPSYCLTAPKMPRLRRLPHSIFAAEFTADCCIPIAEPVLITIHYVFDHGA
jgi:hypothetical protein